MPSCVILYLPEQDRYFQVRIRKLTEKECLRLMNVPDDAIERMVNTCSRTQCYKAAGNSIVCSCLMAIFSQLGIDGVEKWNDMTDEERYELIEC